MYIIIANRGFESIEFRAKFWKVLFALVFILTISEICINDSEIMKKIRIQMSEIKFEDYSTSINFANNKNKELRDIDNSLYRVEDRERFNSNDGLSFGVNTMSFCGSTYSRNLHAFLCNLGYSGQHVTIVSDFGNTIASDMLFGVKYILNAKTNDAYKGYEEKYFDDTTAMLKNPYSLNLGFEVESIDLDKTSGTNPFENFNNIVEKFSGVDEKIYTKHIEKISQSLTNLSLEEQIIFRKLNQRKEAYLEYEFEAEKSENAYLYILRRKF